MHGNAFCVLSIGIIKSHLTLNLVLRETRSVVSLVFGGMCDTYLAQNCCLLLSMHFHESRLGSKRKANSPGFTSYRQDTVVGLTRLTLGSQV